MNDIAGMLDMEIQRTLDELSQLETGTDKAKAALIKLDKLHAERVKELEVTLKNKQMVDAAISKIDELKIRNAELDMKVRQQTEENELKKAELAQKDAELQEAKRGRRWRTALDILGISAPLVAGGYWMYQGLKFEADGQIYSSRTTQWVSGITRLFGKKG